MIVSACLVGCACRYDGKSVPDPLLKAMFEAGDLVPVCPEVLGGLATPRDPAEIVSQEPLRIQTEAGVEVTEAYQAGADQTLAVARAVKTKLAILKSKSPSCGSRQIYDGSFSRQLIQGEGLAARVLRAQGIEVLNEMQAHEKFKKDCTRILFLRHAESTFSADERGRGLTEDGKLRAVALAKKWAERFQIQGIYSSPYRRAFDTVKPWAESRGLEVKMDERLRERKVAEEPIDDFLAYAHRQWLDFDYALPQGECLREVAKRGREALLEIERSHRGETTIVASHGTWMGAVFHAFDPDFSFGDWEKLLMPDLWEMVFYKGNLVNLNRITKE